jgi:hypothetical protein
MLMLQIQVDLVEEAMDGQRTASFLDLRPSTVHGALLCGPQQSHVFIFGNSCSDSEPPSLG